MCESADLPMSWLKDRTIRALKEKAKWRGIEAPNVAPFLNGHREVGFVAWDTMPPAGIAQMTHNLTLMDAFEMASRFLMTDYTLEREHILCGPLGRCYIFTLPRFVPEPVNGVYQFEEGKGIKMGRIFHRVVYYMPGMPSKEMLIFNTGGRVCRFLIQNAEP